MHLGHGTSLLSTPLFWMETRSQERCPLPILSVGGWDCMASNRNVSSLLESQTWHFWGHSYGRKPNVDRKPASEVYQEDKTPVVDESWQWSLKIHNNCQPRSRIRCYLSKLLFKIMYTIVLNLEIKKKEEEEKALYSSIHFRWLPHNHWNS